MAMEEEFMSFSKNFSSRIEQKKLNTKLGQNDDEDDDDFYDAHDEFIQQFEKDITKRKETARETKDHDIVRETLPSLRPPDAKVSVWKVIKDAIGKDLTKFCVPVYFNEPISMLQKVSEIMEY